MVVVGGRKEKKRGGGILGLFSSQTEKKERERGGNQGVSVSLNHSLFIKDIDFIMNNNAFLKWIVVCVH